MIDLLNFVDIYFTVEPYLVKEKRTPDWILWCSYNHMFQSCSCIRFFRTCCTCDWRTHYQHIHQYLHSKFHSQSDLSVAVRLDRQVKKNSNSFNFDFLGSSQNPLILEFVHFVNFICVIAFIETTFIAKYVTSSMVVDVPTFVVLLSAVVDRLRRLFKIVENFKISKNSKL